MLQRAHQWLVATPYAEPGAVRFAQYLQQTGSLRRVLTTRNPLSVVSRVFPDSGLGRRVGRRDWDGVETALVLRRAGASELAHIVSRALGHGQQVAGPNVGRRFDTAVAHYLKGNSSTATHLFAMPGASKNSFRQAKTLGIKTVLHFVNSHPRAHNHALIEAGVSPKDPEVIPEQQLDVIENEIQAADLIIVPSTVVYKDFVRYGVNPSRLSLVRYGSSFDSSSELDNSIQSSSSTFGNILFVGQISRRKGVDLLIEAVERRPSTHLLMVGPVVNRDLLSHLPSNVEHLGPQPNVKVRQLMRQHSMLILPSLSENFGLVVPEALSVGLPVVTTNRVGASDLVRELDAGVVVEAGSAPSLSAAIDVVLSDLVRYRRNAESYVDSAWQTFCSSVVTAACTL